MKRMLNAWMPGLALLFAAVTSTRGVNGDGQEPCWRGQAGTTRQHWRFDTGNSPAAPEIVNNPTGNPAATIIPNANGVGWIDTTCAWLGFGCDPWNGDADPYGTAQGYWDLGGTNASSPSPGTVFLSITNSVAVGATRYLWVQATVWIESGIAGYPLYAVSNAVQVGGTVNLLAENPTNSDGSFTSGAWYNQQTLWAIPATGTVDRVTLRAAGVGTILDAVGVDTLLRWPAANDAASARRNTATNLPVATLLANDGGPVLSIAGVSTPSAQGGAVSLAGGTVTYTPPTGYTGSDSFYYTNSDCGGGTAVGQVMVNVAPATSVIVQLQRDVPGPNTNTLILEGTPNYEYVLQFATNVQTGPWFNFSTNIASNNGIWTTLDSNATNNERFYRIVAP